MANSMYGYVREYEEFTDNKLLPNNYIVVRIDGQKFHNFSKQQNLLKPNDKRCLDLMNESAKHVMKRFFPHIIIAYGQSDEFSFIFGRTSKLYNRRQNKILALLVSSFTAYFNSNWSQYFQSSVSSNPPAFDSRCVLYPTDKLVRDYLSWRQVDCHINNLYNTTFHALTGQYTKYTLNSDNSYQFVSNWTTSPDKPKPLTAREATERLSKTVSSDKHEILFKEYGINYNNELEQFKKGSVLWLKMSEQFFKIRGKQLDSKNTKPNDRGDEDIDLNELVCIDHIDIIKDNFWTLNNKLLV